MFSKINMLKAFKHVVEAALFFLVIEFGLNVEGPVQEINIIKHTNVVIEQDS